MNIQSTVVTCIKEVTPWQDGFILPVDFVKFWYLQTSTTPRAKQTKPLPISRMTSVKSFKQTKKKGEQELLEEMHNKKEESQVSESSQDQEALKWES